MGIGKWWLKHGPGSPGSITKAMMKAFKSIQARNPNLPRDQLLRQTLESRYALAPQRWSIPPELRDKILKEAKGSLVHLVVAVFITERYTTGGYDDWRTADIETKQLAIDVIREEVGEHAPQEVRYTDARWSLDFEKRMGFLDKWLSGS